MGEIIGIVIFQKSSHAVAPSIEDASYRSGEIVCSAAMNRSICTPDFQAKLNIWLVKFDMKLTTSAGRFSEYRKLLSPNA